jgi:hypothetical protein
MIKPLQNAFFLEMPAVKHKVKALGTGLVDLEGKALIIERDDRDHLPQLATIKYAPDDVKGWDYEIPLKQGDKVYCHHFAATDTFKITIGDEILHWQNYEQLYAIQTEDDVIPLEHYVFIEQLYENEDDIRTASGIFTKPTTEAKHLTGVVRHASAYSKELGLSVGDTVQYLSRARYPVKMQAGGVLWKTRVQNINCIV